MLGIESFKLIDFFALAVFFISWASYTLFVDFSKVGVTTLVEVMHRYRLQWMKHMLKREERLVDIRIIGNLLKSTTFFASTAILIIIGLVAAIGAGSKAVAVMQTIPFVAYTDVFSWTVKTLLIIIVFIYAFFKLTWVLRQFNYASILIVAAPVYHKGDDLEEVKKATHYAVKAASMLSNASRHFNMAMRSYYYGLAALSWYFSPYLFIFTSLLVVFVIYRREFMSKTLILLA